MDRATDHGPNDQLYLPPLGGISRHATGEEAPSETCRYLETLVVFLLGPELFRNTCRFFYSGQRRQFFIYAGLGPKQKKKFWAHRSSKQQFRPVEKLADLILTEVLAQIIALQKALNLCFSSFFTRGDAVVLTPPQRDGGILPPPKSYVAPIRDADMSIPIRRYIDMSFSKNKDTPIHQVHVILYINCY
jgi:hypothetical protein